MMYVNKKRSYIMNCKECGAQLAEDAKFCVCCGTKVDTPTVCKHCGAKIEGGNKFCAKCGLRTWLLVSTGQPNTTQQSGGNNQGNTIECYGSKAIAAYWISIVGAIVSLGIRFALQETYYSWSNLLDNRKVVGLDEDIKPFLTGIPIVVAIIVSLLLAKDTISSRQKKLVALIVNTVFISLSLLFIWFDIPYNIIDF